MLKLHLILALVDNIEPALNRIMAIEVTYLTYRLSGLMSQIAENQIKEAINNNNKERIMREEQREKMLSYTKPPSVKCEYSNTFHKVMTLKKQQHQKNKEEDDVAIQTKYTGATNKFFKAAKVAVMVSGVAKDRNICTCSSLDASCHLHDS